MGHENSVKGELLKRIRWDRFEGLVEKHDADRSVRSLTTKSQLIARVHAQLPGVSSLREIELFFLSIKQTLKIKKFPGTSENAVRIQIAVALITYLLLRSSPICMLRMAHAAQSSAASMLTVTRLVRADLMHLRTIRDLGRPPPRKQPSVNQMVFTLC